MVRIVGWRMPKKTINAFKQGYPNAKPTIEDFMTDKRDFGLEPRSTR